jgi:hypothetical protein
MRKKLNIIPISIFLLLSFTACEDYLDVNKNVDAPDRVDAHLLLAGILQSYEGMYWDIRAIGPLTQMMGSSNYDEFANHEYILGSDAGGEVWRSVYWLQGMNLENLINQSVAAEDWTLAGIGYAIKAYSWDQMTKIHGDLPMKDAFVPGLLSHDYDYQYDVYPQVREWAYKAIEYLEMEDAHNYGTRISANDFIYGGDKSKWIKFAYGVIVRNLSSLSNKNNFTADYAQELIDAASKSFASTADDATLRVAGGSADAPFTAFNNFWGTIRNNLTRSWFQHEYAVQVFTGTVPKYNETTGDKVPAAVVNAYYPYELADQQIITDTAVSQPGHYDPRVALKLSTADDATYSNIDQAEKVKRYKYYGGTFSSFSGPIGSAPSYYGRNSASSTVTDGKGKWLYRDNAPYILMTYAELRFCVAETYLKLANPSAALEAFKEGVKADVEFTGKYISTGTKGQAVGGDKITAGVYQALANAYIAGPYVEGLSLTDFSLSHVMMQKWVALYPWGAQEAWVDMRKHHYDIDYSGEYPSAGNGWDVTSVTQKWDTNPAKVFKGLYLAPAQVAHRRDAYGVINHGSPSYRLRPRYNSEYMWNLKSLGSLAPVSGTAENYHTSIPWFAYPSDLPTSN